MNSLEINKITIGTTKLGLEYGAVDQQKVPDDQAIEILKLSHSKGFDMFDTAPSYGNAQQLLGCSFDQPTEHLNIITKLASTGDNDINVSELERVHAIFMRSLKEMNVQLIYGLLIHNPTDLLKSNAEALVNLLQTYKSSGLVNKIGVSVYNPEDARDFFERFDFDLIQLPCNVLDQRFIETGTIAWLKQKSVEIHARSLFLKGVLLKSEIQQGIPEELIVKKTEFHQYLRDCELQPYQACLDFASFHSDVDRWVIGVSKEQHIGQLVAAINHNKLANDNAINFADWSLGDSKALDPRYW